MSDYYTAEELAEKLGMTAQTVKIWAREGRIPSYKPYVKYIFKKKEIAEWLEKRKGAYAKTKD